MIPMQELPQRGFPETEFEQRLERVQRIMFENMLDAIVLTTEPQLRYFSGFFTQFWQSPTRPWFLVIPAQAKPIAVIPEIGVSGMQATWIEDIHSWPSPQPEDDGISLLVNVIRKLPKRFGRVGFTLGLQSTLRMPVNDFYTVTRQLSNYEIVDIALMLHKLLSIKSELEINKIRHVCEITSMGFNALPDFTEPGDSQRIICKKLRHDLLDRGADDIPFMIAGSGQGGYDSIIMGPADDILVDGDILIIDTGTVFDGYFSDFDRNFGFGQIDSKAINAYDALYESTQAGLKSARPGIRLKEIFNAMWNVLEAFGAQSSDVGRMGHGLGMQLTEWPSITAVEDTVAEQGMVLTLEPAMSYAPGKQMVHEENIVITEDGASLLSLRASAQLPVIRL